MSFDESTLDSVFKKTDGRCHICKKHLVRDHHGLRGANGAWTVDHSRARARGGTDHLNNLLPACARCNTRKSTCTSRTARGWHGHTRAPLSREKRQEQRVLGALTGGVLGAIFLGGGLPLVALSALAGAAIADDE